MDYLLWRQLRGAFIRTRPRVVFFSLRKGGIRHGSETVGGEQAGEGQGNNFLLPGATIATLLMLGGLHAKRLYEEKKIEEARQQGIEAEFAPDVKASFLQMLPLRFISRVFGMVTSVDLPVWARPYIYKGYCRAFHANLDEVAEDLQNYSSLQQFFVRRLKEGSRPIESDSSCLLSPVDGIVLRCGQVRGPGLVIEQVKGFSFSLKSLLGTDPPAIFSSDLKTLQEATTDDFKSQRLQGTAPGDAGSYLQQIPSNIPVKGLFFCVLYLGPGDYHRVHSPTDWHVSCRRHFSGSLFPVNERATRTIRNLYVGNERVVLEGKWSQGFMALVAIGAMNVGSIELNIEHDLKTNCRRPISFNPSSPSVRVYGEEGSGYFLKRGEEVATFNLGSTVVLVFQAPSAMSNQDNGRKINLQESSGFSFCVQKGAKVKMGQAIGKWHN